MNDDQHNSMEDIQDNLSELLSNSDEDIEYQITHLESYDNSKQVEILCLEIEHIMEHGIQPCAEWFQLRFQKIHQYSGLEWLTFSNRFDNKNDFIHSICLKIHYLIQQLLDEWSISPIFNLSTYYELLFEIKKFSEHYCSNYIGDETDNEVIDLIIEMKHL